ncbi:ribonuclease HII [Candidatus Roizmanbacteria bacterium]|nr:ribonuclease HII [Candidatus Roizmanbacteria bacterium]
MAKKQYPDFSYETPLWEKGYGVIGIDEVGRGPLAGPVTLGAVCIGMPNMGTPESWLGLGIDDSKRVVEKRRTELAAYITSHALATAVADSSVEVINKKGIVGAIQEATLSCIRQIRLSVPSSVPLYVLCDAFTLPSLPEGIIGQEGIIKGDQKSCSIAAASLIAKVSRDSYMKSLATAYPLYCWEENKGYGTQKHRDALKQYGITPHHRTLFVRSFLP